MFPCSRMSRHHPHPHVSARTYALRLHNKPKNPPKEITIPFAVEKLIQNGKLNHEYVEKKIADKLREFCPKSVKIHKPHVGTALSKVQGIGATNWEIHEMPKSNLDFFIYWWTIQQLNNNHNSAQYIYEEKDTGTKHDDSYGDAASISSHHSSYDSSHSSASHDSGGFGGSSDI